MQALKGFKRRIDKELSRFFRDKEKYSEGIDESTKELVSILKEYTLDGGKRLRSALMFFSYRCFSKKHEEDMIKATMAFELLQSFFLAHDDIMDKDDMRRGKPALHKRYEHILNIRFRNEDNEHLSTSFAMIAGDICLSMANELIAQTSFSEKRKIKAIIYMNKMIARVGYGQALDMLYTNRAPKKEYIRKINILKTATYTIEGPLMMGAILAGKDPSKLGQFKKISVLLGEAFQIQDDVLDIFGEERYTGKPLGSDIKEGKTTEVYSNAIRLSKGKDKNFLKTKLGKDISAKDLNRIRKIIEDSGALEDCKRKIDSMIDDSLKILNDANYRKEGLSFIKELCFTIKERNS